MIKLEAFIILGFLIGVGATLVSQFIWKKISERREAQMIEKAKLEAARVSLLNANTEQLIQELATRQPGGFRKAPKAYTWNK